ncbi:hypothetical protein BDZ97DRAFT_1842788, partial [Flammula alnicola]
MFNQQAQTPPILEIHAPEITLLSRVTSIPIISSSWTPSTSTARALDKRLEHLQVKLAPLVVRVDGYANMAIDAVKPEEVATFVRQRKE